MSGKDYNKCYKASAETWLKAYATRDFELLLKAWPPETRGMLRYYWLMGRDEDESWDRFYENIEYHCGPHVKMSYQLGNVERLDKDDLEYEERQLEYDFDYECDISAGYEVEVEMIFQGADDTYKITDCLTVVKIEGKWYVVSSN